MKGDDDDDYHHNNDYDDDHHHNNDEGKVMKMDLTPSPLSYTLIAYI